MHNIISHNQLAELETKRGTIDSYIRSNNG